MTRLTTLIIAMFKNTLSHIFNRERLRCSDDLSISSFITLTALSNIALFHAPLYQYANQNIDSFSINGLLTLVTLLVVMFFFTALVLAAVALVSVALVKPLIILLTLLNSIALYFIITYQIVFDRSMMSNIFNTRVEESLDLFHYKLLVYFIIFGLAPAWYISRFKIAPLRYRRLLTHMAALLIGVMAFVYINSSTWLWFDKHSSKLGGAILPWSYLINTGRALSINNVGHKDLTLLPDAVVRDKQKILVVLVIGETARAQNFSLYGYHRETNPKLKEKNIAILQGAKSCSTYTTASLHCMLSHTGKTSGNHEPLPSYLQRHGIDVIWRTNNWGELPLSVNTYETAKDLRKRCLGDRCKHDDVLLWELEKRIEQSDSEKIFTVLHTKGSHGPAYHARYREIFDVFKPVCRSVELDKCSSQSLINAYDNTILATDDFLSRVIDNLEKINTMPVLMLYVSDHGESLGEYGLYLHGSPYAIAPNVQKEIPFIVWMSDSFAQTTGVSIGQLEQRTKHSHGQIFHSILGAFAVDSPVYNQHRDIFKQP